MASPSLSIPVVVLAALGLAGAAAAQDAAPLVRPDSARAQEPWHAQLDLGFQDIGGNRSLTVFNGTGTLERRGQSDYILTTKMEAHYGTSSGFEAVNYQALAIRYDVHPRTTISPFLGLDVQRDASRLIATRAQVGTGINYNTDYADDRRTYFSLGIVAEHIDYFASVSPAATDHFRWMVRASTARPIAPVARIEVTFKLQPSFTDGGDYLVGFAFGLRFVLSKRLGFATKFEYREDSRPAVGVLPDDHSLTAALSFVW